MCGKGTPALAGVMLQVRPAGKDHQNANDADQRRGNVGRPGEEHTEAGRALSGVPHADRDQRTDGDEGDGQSDAEAGDEGDAERELPQAQAEQQHRNRGRTGNKPTGQPEQDRLQRRRPSGADARLDLARMGERMRIHGAVVVVMIVLMVMAMIMMVRHHDGWPSSGSRCP